MPDAPFTEAEVEDLIAANKYIYKVMEDNRGQPNTNEIRLTYEIRRIGKEHEDLHLRLFARLEKQPNAASVKPQPGVSFFGTTSGSALSVGGYDMTRFLTGS